MCILPTLREAKHIRNVSKHTFNDEKILHNNFNRSWVSIGL